MEEIVYQKTYKEYKEELDRELSKTAESFVKIGYLLKVARDTDILLESGYKNMAEFASKEYGLSETYVSRFIRINDRFSEGGYSDHLMPEYKGFGYAKLAIMLQLPDSINEELTPNYSKADIQAIRDEVAEENKVSDIERMLEKPQTDDTPVTEQVIFWLGKDEQDMYMQISERMEDIWSVEDIKEIMAPAGEKTYIVRVPGMGRMMLMIGEEELSIVSMRTGEKTETGWGELGKYWEKIAGSKGKWEELYHEQFPEPEKEKIAPVQPENKQEKPKKESKVVKAKPEKVAKPQQKKPEIAPVQQETLHSVEPSIPEPMNPPEETEKEEEQQSKEPEESKGQQSKEQIEGQDSIENHEEWMPDTADAGKETADTEPMKKSALVKARMRFEILQKDMEEKDYRKALGHAENLVLALREAFENE